MSDRDELHRLEQTLARLDHELGEARRALVALLTQQADRGAAAASPPNPAPSVTAPAPGPRAEPALSRPVPAPRPRAGSGQFIEQLIGRYGALALAVVTIVMGAGALVSWALHQGLLTPAVRVLLGSLLALTLAGAGLLLRARGSRPFGHTLLALALAVVHVVAWGAGPQLGLVRVEVSLAIAAVASAVLSALALHDESEALFAVGVGGALLAPFVQRSGAEHFVLLAAYGAVVSIAALRTIAARPWVLVAAIVGLAVLVYAQALGAYHADAAWMSRNLTAAFILVLSAAALVLTRPPLRPWIVLAVLVIGVVSIRMPHLQGDTPRQLLTGAPDVLLVAMTGAALALFAARELPAKHRGWWIGGALFLPAAYLLRALGPLAPAHSSGFGGVTHAAVAGIWVLGYAVAAVAERGVRRGALLAASGVVATWAAVLAVHAWPYFVPVACAGVAIVAVLVSRREKQPLVLLAAALAAVVGYWHGFAKVTGQFGYAAPFSTMPTLSLAVGVAGLGVAARLVPEATASILDRRIAAPIVAQVAFAVACFLWWCAELARAYSADAATFLLIVYYAACGVLVLWRGRVVGSQRLRQAGLTLSLWAAFVALTGASSVQQIALRVGSYLAVGGFLLGVAWWYRAEQGPESGSEG
jgi:hypothetical protein